MKNKKMEQEENKTEEVTQEVQEVTNEVVTPVEEASQEQEVIDSGKVEEPVTEVLKRMDSEFDLNEFSKDLQLAIKHFTNVYGQTRDMQAAEIAKSCGTILSKILSRK